MKETDATRVDQRYVVEKHVGWGFAAHLEPGAWYVMADQEGDESFHDDWWESLAIDQDIESQLNAVEQQAEMLASSSSSSLGTHMPELRAMYEEQQHTINQLRQQAQQQQGEISVVRSNLSRAQQQNRTLQQHQQQMEQDYRHRIETLQQEHGRQMERLEATSAFRRIEQDSNRTVWPSTTRRRAPVVFSKDALATPMVSGQDTPTRYVASHRQRAEPETPSRPRSFPHFDNSFVDPAPSSSPATAPDVVPSSSTPTPDSSPHVGALDALSSDDYEYVLAALFTRQARWTSHILGHPPRSQTGSMLLHLVMMDVPECPSFSRTAEQLWQCVARAGSYEAFLCDCAPIVRLYLQRGKEPQQAVRDVWADYSPSLYGGVATLLCAATHMLLQADKIKAVCHMLDWMTALGLSQPAFVSFLACRDKPMLPDASVSPPITHILIDGMKRDVALYPSVVRLSRVLAWSSELYGYQDVHPVFHAKGMLLALLDTHEPSVLIPTLQLCTLVVSDATTLHMCLSAQFDPAWQPRVSPRLGQVRFPVVDVLSKHLVDRRGDMPAEASHRIHMSILLFLTRAARWPDTSIMLAESTPLLPALIQCLSWDVSTLWNTEPVPDAPGTRDAAWALERVCQSVQFLHDLYMPEGIATRNLAEKLVSAQAQAVLNGVRYAFIVALGRIAFANEPDWLTHDTQAHRRRTQLECAAMLASDLIDSVLSPNETDEIYELLAEEAE